MLLNVATGVMERIVSSNTSAKEASNLKVMADFVAELRFLAEYGLGKARREADRLASATPDTLI